MRRPLLHALPLALAVALLAGVSASAATTPAPKTRATATAKAKANSKAKAKVEAKSKPKPAVVTRGLDTILQDDGLFLFRPVAEIEAAAARAKALGIDTVRLTAGWSTLTRDVEQPLKPAGFDARDPGSYEQGRWTALDAAVRAVRGRGLRVLLDIGFWAPRWATTDPGPRARANIDPQAYADFATAVALRYSGAFTPPVEPPGAPPPAPTPDESLIQSILQSLVPFPIPPLLPPPPLPPPSARAAQDSPGGAQAPNERLPKVDEFALWNEPNHQGLLLPQWDTDGTTPASPRVYRAMLRAAFAAVKSARHSSSVKVLIGNTSSTGGTRGVGPVPPLEFLRDLACVDRDLHPVTTGDCASFTMLPGDGWAHHPYSQNERPSRTSKPPVELDDLRMADLPQLATTLDTLVRTKRIAPANRNIFLTEFGYETQPVAGRPTIDELTQARWLTWAEYLADRIPQVRSFAQFLLRDQPPAKERVSESKARPFGQYSTGLLLAGGRDKVAAKTFLAGLFAQLRSKGRVLIYGRLRLGAGRRTVTLQRRRRAGPWEKIATLKVDGRSAFTRTIAHAPGATYRLGYPARGGSRKSSIAIKPVPAKG
ncbi:MAG TPA: hypothetical protein VGO80_17745 [Solirubrobacteraceae bacterium]|jgi:hypothetical protein|nr:hypothetical protein [Solirubrobacteraceae bacterium]